MVAKIALILSLVALLVAAGTLYLTNIQTKIIIPTSSEKSSQPSLPQITQSSQTTIPASVTMVNSTIISIFAPAVDNKGNGIATKLTVQTIPGQGRILTNINNLLFWVDTQQSIQIAESVAQNITKVNISNVDLIYTIETNATVIEGPSAGAAITIATIAALQNKPLNTSVMITGTINPDGIVGPVGGIVAKAKAAKDIGATLFLVPEGQGVQTTYVPKQNCQQIGSFTFCTTEYVKQTVDTKKSIGIQVIEVSNMQEALKYFLVQ